MKRDRALMCRILRQIEAEPSYGNLVYPTDENTEADVIAYHVHLAAQAGFLATSGSGAHTQGALPRYTIHGLTWDGHEFLDPNGCKSSV